MVEIESERLELPFDDRPRRQVQVRLEGPVGWRTSVTARPVVTVLHGFKGFMDWGFFPDLSRRLAAAGWVTVSMNASGSGIGDDPEVISEDEAFAHNTFTSELEDLLRVRAFARGLPGVDPDREGLLGHSRGGGVALLAAGDAPPRALVTWSAIDDVDRCDDASKERWRRDGRLEVPNGRTGQVHWLDRAVLEDVERHRARLDIRAAAARVEAPTLVVHARDDTVVDAAGAEALASALPRGELLLLDSSGHTFGAGHPYTGAPASLERVLDATLTHFRRHLDA